jgi:type VI secretion system protein ImpE
MNAKELYQAGQLAEALAAAADEVKRHPLDPGPRAFLCELLCFAGDIERADRQLDALGTEDPKAVLGIALFRHLLRAEQARAQFYSEGRLPEFLDQPSSGLRCRLEASIRLREGRAGEAAELLERAEEERPKPNGICDGTAFDDLRDLDDLTASFFEVLTSNGKYYWIPIERTEVLEFQPPERPRDLLWRRVHMVVRGGPDAHVFLPALYPGSHAESDDRLRLGRLTQWRGGDGAPVRGVGQRMFLVGDQDRSIMELEKITFNNPASGAEDGATSG